VSATWAAALALAATVGLALAAPAAGFDPVVPGHTLEFPRDFGAHPGFRIEWWYVTGQLDTNAVPLGFQVTFFRVRNPDAESNPSRFSPRQVVFAHAALSDPARGRLLHDERTQREFDGLVEARTGNTDVRLDDWTFVRDAGVYRARIESEGFTLDLAFTPTQPVLLEGDRGFSRKGPLMAQASYYYSEPQLAVAGRVVEDGTAREVTGTAWLDHEWSSEPLAEDAAGWDWLGANLEGGGALMALRMRARDGGVLWSQATLREPGRAPVAVEGGAVTFTPRRTWTSPRTGVAYPVGMTIAVGNKRWSVEPLMDDQELDARASTGTLYWEGAVRVAGDGAPGGRGYLELTGYGGRKPY
jgi:predicted secreted hydrolase